MPVTPIRDKWPSSMTDRERFNRQMHHQPVDRCFNMEFGYWKENFRAWPVFLEHGITDNHRAHELFSFDRIETVGGNVWLDPPFERREVDRTGTSRIIRNEEGLLAEVPLDDHGTIPHFIEATVKTPEDWRPVKAARLDVDNPRRLVDIEAIRAQHPPGRDYPLGVSCGSMIGKVRDMLTVEGLAYACYDYPEMVEDMVETCCRLVEHFLDQVLGEIDFDFASGWEDICFKNGPLVSVDFFHRVVVPRYRRIGRRLAEAGIDIWYTDCDGDIRPLLDGFMEGGINTMFPFEVNSSGHPGPVLDARGPELRILGGVDKIVLAKGPEAIREYLESLVPYVEKGGFIPHCDHRCPPDVSQENYFFYLDLKQELFGR